MCNDTLIQSIKNSTEIHCYLHQQYFAALAQYHIHVHIVSRSSSNTLFFPHHCECPSSLFIFCCSFSCSFYTLNQLTIQFFVLTPATVQRDELSIQTVPLQDADVYLVCRFATCLHFLAEIFQDLESKHQKCFI